MTAKKQTPARPPSPGWWDTWFWRLIQLVGAATFVEQVVVGQRAHHDRPWILLFAAAMTLGSYGMQIGLRALTRILGSGE